MIENELIENIEKNIIMISQILGKPLDKGKILIDDRGIPHEPRNLPKGKEAVYIFIYRDKFLKIGRVGKKSNPRFKNQHYSVSASKSTLANQILNNENFKKIVDMDNIEGWIKHNCRRIDILLDANSGDFLTSMVEAILQYKYEPLFEGRSSQRKIVL